MGTAERKRKPSFIYVVIGALLLAAFVLLLTNLFFHPGVSQNIKKDVLSEDHFFSRVFASEERVDFFEEYVLSLDEDEKLLISCWATWCSPCLRELPLLQKNIPQLKEKKINTVLLNYDSGSVVEVSENVEHWLGEKNISIENLFDNEDSLLKDLGVHSLPFSLLVDSQGKILWYKIGELHEKDLEFRHL